MGQVTLEGDVETGRKEVNDGRLWIGKEYEGKEVEYAIKVVDENPEETEQ